MDEPDHESDHINQQPIHMLRTKFFVLPTDENKDISEHNSGINVVFIRVWIYTYGFINCLNGFITNHRPIKIVNFYCNPDYYFPWIGAIWKVFKSLLSSQTESQGYIHFTANKKYTSFKNKSICDYSLKIPNKWAKLISQTKEPWAASGPKEPKSGYIKISIYRVLFAIAINFPDIKL